MEQQITKDLKKLKLQPRSRENFQEIAQKLTGKSVPKEEAKAVVREEISDGQVKASNDNVEGLQAQVEREQNGGKINREKAYMFDSGIFTPQEAEAYLDKRNIRYAKPKTLGGRHLLAIDNIRVNDIISGKKVDNGVTVLFTPN